MFGDHISCLSDGGAMHRSPALNREWQTVSISLENFGTIESDVLPGSLGTTNYCSA